MELDAIRLAIQAMRGYAPFLVFFQNLCFLLICASVLDKSVLLSLLHSQGHYDLF